MGNLLVSEEESALNVSEKGPFLIGCTVHVVLPSELPADCVLSLVLVVARATAPLPVEEVTKGCLASSELPF